MKIGYPCINRSIGCTSNSTFRLANYTDKNLIEKVSNNLNCLQKILEYNVDNDIFFFRISSDLIPFASHPICSFMWQIHFNKRLSEIGSFIKKHNIRISMHPDQFVLINAIRKDIISRSIADLTYHCEVLDLMKLDYSAKVQIHVGGVYGDKESAIKRFTDNYNNLPELIKRRLAIENDERLYSLKDCLSISKKTGIPIVFDSFHHICFNNGEVLYNALALAQKTWKKEDGILMVDYSSQRKGARIGSHAEHINTSLFRQFIEETEGIDFDIMLEIKDKEKSALDAIKIKNEKL